MTRYWLGSDGMWHHRGWVDVAPGESPSDPTIPPDPTTPTDPGTPARPALRIREVSLTATNVVVTPPPVDPGGGTTPPPNTSSGPYYGACIASGASGPQTVVTKYGNKAAVRQFHPATTGTLALPLHPANASIVHTSWKVSPTPVLNGSLDAQINAIIDATPNGDIIEFNHEHDVTYNHLTVPWTAAQIAAQVECKSYLYDMKQKRKPGVLVCHTFGYTTFSNSRSDAYRDMWLKNARGDLIGIDMDGDHTPTGPTYTTNYSVPASRGNPSVAKYRAGGFKGWTVPEFGTSRQPWDATGVPRADWFKREAAKFQDAYCIHLFDYNMGAHTTATDYNQVNPGTPEMTVWRNFVASNPA